MKCYLRQEDNFQVSDVSGAKSIEDIAKEFGAGTWVGVLPAVASPAEIRRNEILAQLNALDLKAIRPLLENDTVRVSQILIDKQVLRNELNNL